MICHWWQKAQQEFFDTVADFRDAFHTLPVHPDERKFGVAQAFDGEFLVFDTVVFGGEASPLLWGRAAAFLIYLKIAPHPRMQGRRLALLSWCVALLLTFYFITARREQFGHFAGGSLRLISFVNSCSDT